MLLDKVKKKFDLSVVKSVELEDMAIDFTGPDPWASTLSSNQLIANLAHIPGFSWPIQQVQLKDNGINLGHLESPFTAATVVRGRVLSSISHSTMKVFAESHTAFAGFIAAMATQRAHTFSIKGTADIIFNLGLLGVHTIHGIDFVSDLTLRGLDSIRDIRCTAITEATLGVDDKGRQPDQGQGHGTHMLVNALFDIYNPSQLLLTLGDCVLALSVPSKDENDPTTTDSDQNTDLNTTKSPLHHHQIGTLHLDNLTLLLGENDARTGAMVLDTTIDATRQFLKNAEHTPQRVHLSGFQGTSKNEALAAGLVALSTSLELPVFHASSLLPEPSSPKATTRQ
ncbi:hypothetical protein KVV02_001545 [Mortierella alpina]|uniref:Uncharacterized protein n=1 Tax=Mortierella alpina TaxID=64518 RepID=A0A9P8A1P0_MORAP|nr:hypothetical protein KVV02_001545 [Mortierella alpina]